ncbi:urease accessory protein UreE [Methylobacterium sp. W2]|uniref:urease accessory protein UreE n=1 Tax=Methylobacterium sp. W2 TaxID=2598107 RepID=UPI001D0C5BC2|nr:urease accessory protein UreE [Methylobacterium sp. W2]MCC0807830.1 urease accessory protein UreE [Methylobacterium sp. W2]
MRVIDRIVGSRLDPEIAHRLHHLDHHHAVDILAIDSADIARRRLRATTEGGEDIAIALPREETLFDGAVLILETDRALVVRVGAERWLRLVPGDKAAALELGYHAGNLHWRVRFDGDDLLVALEGPPEDYLARLGDLTESGRVAHGLDGRTDAA